MKHARNLKTFALFAFLLAISFPAFSQGGPGGRPGGQGGRPQMTEEDVKNRVDRMAQGLELSDDQAKKIKDYEVEMFKKNQVEFQKLRGSGDRTAMREYMMKQREERNEKYKGIMTEEQYKKFTEQQEQRRQDMQNRRQQGPGQEGGDRPARGRGRG